MKVAWEMTNTTITPFDVENFTPFFNISFFDNSTNSTSFPSSGTHASRFSVTQMVIIAILSGSLSVITVAGNIMVMVSFKIDKQLQTISNYFLFSLAVADVTVGLISMPLFTVYTIMGYWPLGAHLCDAWLALDYLASNASVLNLLIISFDRYFSVTRPLTYRAKRSPVKAGFMIICAWGISLLLWPPWIYAWPHIEGKRTVPDDDCYIQFIQTNQYITFGTAIAAFYVPVTVMCVLYWRIWKETEKRQKDLPNLQGGKQDNSKRSTSSEEQTAVAELDGWARVRSSSNTISADCEVMDTSFSSKGFNTHQFNRPRPKIGPKARPFTWTWLRESCVAWWHSGNEDYELEDYWDDTNSEVGVGTPLSGETPLQSSVSRCTSLNVIKEPSTMNPQSRVQDSRSIAQTNRLVSSRSVSSDSVYTILIRLPASDCEGTGGEGPSIKMIPEHFSKTAPASLISRGRSEFANTTAGQPITRRPSNIADIRMPLNPKVISKQMVTGSKSILPIKPKPLKKKKKPVEKKADKKAAKTLSAILLAFILTWTPYNILVLLKPLTAFPDYVSKGLWDFFYYLCYINSTINPVCYALCNASFRRTYVRILSCKWKKKHRIAINRGFYN
ncbi:muscarinic acetylcholine receptor DM1 isoform X2 [Planococcus citri]|uniref:muscarinic acetylcholine receptor DM1 isoform X2 n=1 Tax=Planococcus citri TaxID=170843 RepID=UPI0031F7AB40